ncbi:Nramp family divalent metal transporter [Pseudalkalibacillus sp. A8]|uniref:Nramp family divalent metal transporter n=1 Tax=Pseudalkalibacillus sp. A8 TaxID=3382641 RepID=UPI0038B44C04
MEPKYEHIPVEQEVEKKENKFLQTVRQFGPGIVAVLAMMGAGDLVSSSVSGANYGYDLMWILAGSLIIRFVVVNAMARYELCNIEQNSILEGYQSLGRFFPWFFMISTLIIGHLINSYMISGAGQALSWIFNFGSPFLWSCGVVLISLFVIGRNVYKSIENLMKLLLGVMTISFLGIAIYAVPNFGGILRGTIGFGVPENQGVFSVFLIALSLIGAVGGSLTNFLYPYYAKEKGWNSPAYLKIQRYDLLFGISAAIIINLALWVVGAEVLRPNGIQVSGLDDISKALSTHMGYFGALVFYLGVFGILYSSVVGFANGYPKLVIDCLHMIKKERRQKYGRKFEDDPMFKWVSLFILISPIIWSIPGMPGFVAMVVFVNALQGVIVPIIAFGLLMLTNKTSHLGKYKNNWLENVVLSLTTALTIWVTFEWFIGLF